MVLPAMRHWSQRPRGGDRGAARPSPRGSTPAAAPRARRASGAARVPPWSRRRAEGNPDDSTTIHTTQGAYTVLDWPCTRVRPRARNPPTRMAREARSSRRTSLRCGAGLRRGPRGAASAAVLRALRLCPDRRRQADGHSGEPRSASPVSCSSRRRATDAWCARARARASRSSSHARARGAAPPGQLETLLRPARQARRRSPRRAARM